MNDLSVMLGEVPTKINQDGETITFQFESGKEVIFYHGQDCCEEVYIEDVNGEWGDLIGNPLIIAEERVNPPGLEGKQKYEFHTWTFYTFRGIGGSVDVRWYGTSNGYYSESVDMKVSDKGAN